MMARKEGVACFDCRTEPWRHVGSSFERERGKVIRRIGLFLSDRDTTVSNGSSKKTFPRLPTARGCGHVTMI